MTLARRLEHHFRELEENPAPFCHAEPKDRQGNLSHWTGHIDGPDETPFAGGRFQLTIDFPSNYPFRPPQIRFVTPVFHPNISPTGEICLDILHSQWSPVLSLRCVLISLCSLLSDPNDEHGLNHEALHLYRTDRARYAELAKEWTRDFAEERNKE